MSANGGLSGQRADIANRSFVTHSGPQARAGRSILTANVCGQRGRYGLEICLQERQHAVSKKLDDTAWSYLLHAMRSRWTHALQLFPAGV
jgi:hypothetical protein